MKKLKKFLTRVRLLGFFNLLLGLLFAYAGLATITSGYGSLPTFGYLFFWLAMVGIGIVNLYFAYRLILEKPSIRFIKISGFTFLAITFILSFFFGSLIASISGAELLVFLVPFTFCWIFFPYSKKLAGVIVVLFFLLGIISFFSGFEESYCWQKGTEAEARYGVKLLQATIQEKKDDPGITEITPSWRAHLACHRTFDFQKAFKDEMSLK